MVSIAEKTYPAPQCPEQYLKGVYGDDWREPCRAVRQGGEAREDRSVHGDCYKPKLAEEIQRCIDRGWDRTRYHNELRWPRMIAGAGPIGPTGRTVDSSRALWWRTTDELIEFF